MGIAWGSLAFAVALLFCGGMCVLAYSIVAEGLPWKKRIGFSFVAVVAMSTGLMVQGAVARLDERITTLELEAWLHERGTAEKVIDALK